jgi:hypothetical protein
VTTQKVHNTGNFGKLLIYILKDAFVDFHALVNIVLLATFFWFLWLAGSLSDKFLVLLRAKKWLALEKKVSVTALNTVNYNYIFEQEAV